MNKIHSVLDHGELVLVDSMGSDLSIVRSARVSYDGKGKSTDEGLINYLMKHNHNTPFESCTATFQIKAPIFVVRQWHRHRTQCLSADTKLKFKRPNDGKPYWKNLGEIVDQWHTPEIPVKRPDKQLRTRRQFNRDRIQKLELYCIEDGNKIATTKITDVMISGQKEVFEITSVRGDKIKASKDHRFQTDVGWKTLEDLVVGDRILTISKIAPEGVLFKFPNFHEEELKGEVWRHVDPSLKVSTLGRVKRNNKLITPTVNKQKRLVVSVKNKEGEWSPKQVSRLIMSAFVDGDKSLHVLHNDDNPLNNRLSNLRYGTDQDNHDDAFTNNRRAFNGVTTLEIESIELIGLEETYDIEVEHKDHNFIANNFCTHNSYNEISARYTELPEEFYIPEASQITTQSKDNKQMRSDEVNENAETIQGAMEASNSEAFKTYHDLIALGTPRELARAVLPVGTYTKMFATANLINWYRFLGERLHPHAQYEIRVYAEAILEELEKIYPVATRAFRVHQLGEEIPEN